jgi:hypothetical protein
MVMEPITTPAPPIHLLRNMLFTIAIPNITAIAPWRIRKILLVPYPSIEVLGKLGFDLAEIEEKFVLLSHKAFKKLKIPKVLNWDSTRYPEQNIVNIVKDEKSFKRLIKQKPKIIRIALHPRDPHSALEEQKQMISQLKDLGYMMPTYGELIPKLQEANHFRRYKQ